MKSQKVLQESDPPMPGTAERETWDQAGEILKRIPRTLYKYTTAFESRYEWLERLMVSSDLYFPSARQFNDPLDCRIPFDFNATEIKIRHHWSKWCTANKIYGPKRKKEIQRLVRE